MSQQINLLPPRQRNFGVPASIAVFALLAVAALLTARAGSQEVGRLRAEALRAEQRLAQLQDAASRAQAGNPQASATALEAEVALLRPRAAFATEFLRQIDTGLLGRRGGYSAHFAALGQITDESVWLSAVAIGRAGTSMTLSGTGLSNEAVLQYSRRASDKFSPLGATLRSLDMRPAGQAPNSPDPAPPGAVGFRLS